MKKKKKSNLSPKKGIAKNKKVLIIIVLLFLVSLGIIGFTLSQREEYKYIEPSKYFTGNLYSANHAANMFDYVYTENNLIISPFNVNTTLALIYNATDNNSSKEINKYFSTTTTKLNEEFNLKLKNLEEKSNETNKYTKLYDKFIKEFYDNDYDILTIDTIKLLTKEEKDKIILLATKINLTIECIEKESSYKESYINKYELLISENEYNEYNIKELLENIIDYHESYSIKNNVNNYIHIYSKNIDILKDFKNNTSMYNYEHTELEEDDSNNQKIINDNIKEATSGKITRIVESPEIIDKELILINTLEFEYKWDDAYKIENVSDTEFYNIDDEIEAVEMMYSTTDTYLENSYAKGFKKDFENGKYSFVAILPKNTGDFTLSSLDIDSLLLSEKEKTILTGMPKITYQGEVDLKNIIKNYGINEIFSEKANFTKLTDDKIVFKEIKQKISLTIGEKGTIQTSRYSSTKSMTSFEYEDSIVLNRPYAYLIINNETNEIMFIGKVSKIN